MMNKRTVAIIIGIVVIIAAVVISIRLTQKPVSKEVIKIGAILPLTGNLAFLGEPERDALILASEHLQQRGLSIQVKFYDSQGDPKTATAAMRQAIVADGIRFFLASLSGVCMALKPIADSQDVFLGAIAFHPDITTDAKHTVRFLYDGKKEADMIANFVLKDNPSSILLLASRDPLSEVQVREVIRPRVSNAGISFQEEWFELGTKDYRAPIAKLRALSPSHVIVLGYGSDIKLLLTQMLEQGAIDSVRIIGGIGFVELEGQVPYQAVQNAVFIAPKFLASGSQRFQQLKEEFKKRWNRNITYDAVYAYDALHILAEVLSENPSMKPDSLRAKLLSREFTGVAGQLRFDRMGNLQTELAIIRYGSQWELLLKEGS